jgi:hypothetical protein
MSTSYLYLILYICLLHLSIATRYPAIDKKRRYQDGGAPYSLITKKETRCEVEALSIGSALADNYNSLDEGTEWDSRIHSDYLSEYAGFFHMITQGIWGKNGKTSELRDSNKLQIKGKWKGMKNITESSYWALENQWLYMMGDSTQRQIWATFVSPSQGNNFERNSKEWTRENCRKQYPHRRQHPANGNFPEEGWTGKCGNNEVTCDLSGYGPKGKITFDWKHFPYEDYDEWIYGESGPWGHMKDEDSHTHEVISGPAGGGDNANAVLDTSLRIRRYLKAQSDLGNLDLQLRPLLGKERFMPAQNQKRRHLEDHTHHHHNHDHDHDQEHRELTSDAIIFQGELKKVPKITDDELRRPDILVIEVGLHTCFHAWDNNAKTINDEYVVKHENDLPVLFNSIKKAISRPNRDNTTYKGIGGTKNGETLVIISSAGRIGTGAVALDQCSWRFNRQLSIEAHKAGFPVFEREEIERRLLFKSDSHMKSHTPKYIKPGMHLDAPGPQIIATSLLSLISCLRRDAHDTRGAYPYHSSPPSPAASGGSGSGSGDASGDAMRRIPIHSSADDDKQGNSFE